MKLANDVIDKLYANWLFDVFWEISSPFWPILWFAIIQNLIRIFANQWFTVLPVWIFAIFGELIVFYLKKIAFNLKAIALSKNMVQMNSESASTDTFEILRSMKQIYYASNLLHHRFSTTLITNCLLSFIVMLTSSYNVIEYISDKYVVIPCWDGMDVLDSFTRFLLVCHTVDRIRGAVNINYNVQNLGFINIFYNVQAAECVPVLRELRDRFRCADQSSYNECIKVRK